MVRFSNKNTVHLLYEIVGKQEHLALLNANRTNRVLNSTRTYAKGIRDRGKAGENTFFRKIQFEQLKQLFEKILKKDLETPNKPNEKTENKEKPKKT